MQIDIEELFSEGGHDIYGRMYIDDKKFYSRQFNTVPVVHLIPDLKISKAVEEFRKQYADEIEQVYWQRNYKLDKKKYNFMQCIMVLKEKRMLSFNMHQLDILTPQIDDDVFVNTATDFALKFKRREREGKYEINLITNDAMQGMGLTRVDVNKTRLNLALNYEDDFAEVDKIIRARLNKKNDKGIVLLHGIPGSGKTTYLRFLIGRVKKKVMFVPPNVAGNMTNPDFVNILIENPNSVLIIEDAENIIADRKESGSSAVSNLLNISDGLLADCLNTQIICTFNTKIQNIDDALLRKGRLIAKYEFKKLSVSKAQQLANHLKLEITIAEPMSLTELYNHHEKNFEEKKKRVGFNPKK